MGILGVITESACDCIGKRRKKQEGKAKECGVQAGPYLLWLAHRLLSVWKNREACVAPKVRELSLLLEAVLVLRRIKKGPRSACRAMACVAR